MVRKDNPQIPYSLSNFPKVLPDVKFFTTTPTAIQDSLPQNNKEIKAFVGWDGIVIFDENLDILQTLKMYAKQYQNYAQSCGRCTPGKYGGKVLYELLNKLQNDENASLEDIEKLKEVCELMSVTSKCEVGKTTPKPILQMLESKPEIFYKNIKTLLHKKNTIIQNTSEILKKEQLEIQEALQSLRQSQEKLRQTSQILKNLANSTSQDEMNGHLNRYLNEMLPLSNSQQETKDCMEQDRHSQHTNTDSKVNIKTNSEVMQTTLNKVDYKISRHNTLQEDIDANTLHSHNDNCIHENVFESLERYKSAIKTRVDNLEYISKITAPCTDECPSRVDIPAYIEGVKDMRFLDSLSSTRSSMPLAQVCGRVCPHPCENACRRAILDEPISIMELKRIGADAEYNLKFSSRWSGYANPNNMISNQDFENFASVGVIGAGPAGLSSAYYMALRGIKVEVYEALPVLGGEVAVGVPNYRMPIKEYNHDIAALKDLGVQFHVNYEVNAQNIKELEQKHSALVIAVGTRASKKLGCKNENVDLQGYLPAIKFMDSVNLAQKFNIGGLPNLKGKKVVCVGGGFTSMDVVRCCVRLGAQSVIMLYRRDEATIIKNTSSEEYHEACEEGVEFQFLSAVDEIVDENGIIKTLKINRYELIKSETSPKGELKLIEDGGVILDCDILIPAVSQEMDFELDSDFGVSITKWKTIEVDNASYSTTKKGIFAAGDCVSGPLTIVNAVGHGRRVASVVANYLQTGNIAINDDERMEDVLKQIGVFDKNREVHGFLSGNAREISNKLSPEYRATNFEEVNFGLSREDALHEASRCMRCYYISMCVVGA